MTNDRPGPTPFAGSHALTRWLLAAALAIAATALGLGTTAGNASAPPRVPAGVGAHLSTPLDAVTLGATASFWHHPPTPRPTPAMAAELVGLSAVLLALSLSIGGGGRRVVVAGVTLPSRRAPPRRRSSR